MPGKCLFSDRWLENSSYKLWLERDADKFKAKCRVCMKAFDVSNMGESALKSHEKGKKHIHLIEKQQRNTTGDIRNLFSNSSFAAPRTATESNNSTLTVSSSAASTTAGMSGFVTRNDTLTAEIWWALKVNSSHYSMGVVELLLLMSHGQATVERGFSVNKEVAVENLSERSFIAQRIIHDHIESVGGLANVKISKQLLMASAGVRQKYISYLEEQKRIKVSQENTLKRKAAMDGIDVLKKKKRQIETDIEALLKTADEFADRAEDSRNLTWVAKSNSLRRSAKEKRAVLKDIEEQLEGKLQELKNN
ncbi:unnamed protein product [Pocillopora meandrina]|uniref:BED-type domain-containing protein n=1 Tax=Pocillopora meandrina TaxID=46732 RepID=A0AAU9VKL5_9CNID|nr:unnamed protein product [Pocillopora meandrina]